jgi:UDP-N-acetylmuramoylalanine--D-glutamate ligase
MGTTKHTAGLLRDVRDVQVSVIGAARSGIGVAKLLASVGARVFVSDAGDAVRLKAYIDELERFTIPYETGKHSDQIFDAEIVVISPGIPSDAPVVLEAQKRGIKVVSELEVASWYCTVPIIAVTGTNGKTTTTTLLGRMLHDAGRQHIVAGNIGDAFSNYAAQLNSNSVAVVEVSSFQLDHIETFRPKVAVMLNITPDHLNRYGNSMERYIESKARIFQNQRDDDVLIYNADDTHLAGIIHRARSKTVPFSVERPLTEGAFLDNDQLTVKLGGKKTGIIKRGEVMLPGLHNCANALAALLAASFFGVDEGSLRNTLRTFRGVEHRLEFVKEIGGITFVNDSKATNVESTWHALRSFSDPLILMLGGRDKGNDYSRIDELVREKVKGIVAIGESAEKVREHFQSITKVVSASSMEEAIDKSFELAERGDLVLLSPACASFDWFDNYEHRGQVFKKLVEQAAQNT